MKSAVVLLVLHCILAVEVKEKVECLADLNGPTNDPNNIYRCDKTQKCCQEGGVPSCCKEKPLETAAWEQAQLWGILAAMILVLGLLMWYCRHDGDWCGNKKGEKGCCCCTRPENPEGEDVEEVVMPEMRSEPVDDDLDSGEE